jgi:transposase InsO family protein
VRALDRIKHLGRLAHRHPPSRGPPQRSTVGIAPRSHRSALSRLERRWRMGGPGAFEQTEGSPILLRGGVSLTGGDD